MSNRTFSDPSLIDILKEYKKDTLIEMNCHALGLIQSFDASNQTCTVKINYKKTLLVQKPDGSYDKKFIEYPTLLDCPTIILSGGKSGLTFPIKEGDSCLVLFCDRDIDNWFSGSDGAELASNRLHSLSDGIALVGLKSLKEPLTEYDTANVNLFNETAGIKVKPNQLDIHNSTFHLGALLRELSDAIKNIVTINCVVGAPVTLNPASIAAIEAVAVKIEGLLT